MSTTPHDLTAEGLTQECALRASASRLHRLPRPHGSARCPASSPVPPSEGRQQAFACESKNEASGERTPRLLPRFLSLPHPLAALAKPGLAGGTFMRNKFRLDAQFENARR
ncbi:hypothetical protein EVAR_6080_1 [Eumeta japonica]|uniref:Uncharacterized protein n=1 Tax=Eumeta variegata TaxID=151549 RepID=A0A4C1TEX4_EUMVA|nr:hypothetical protein EVAR_6080_1 [Eumeta japonica]